MLTYEQKFHIRRYIANYITDMRHSEDGFVKGVSFDWLNEDGYKALLYLKRGTPVQETWVLQNDIESKKEIDEFIQEAQQYHEYILDAILNQIHYLLGNESNTDYQGVV